MEKIHTYILSTNTEQFNICSLIDFIYKEMQNKSYHNRLHYKKYENDKLVQLFTESSQEYTKWEIYNICRSIIFSSDTGKIITYSHPNIEYLSYEDAQQYFTSTTKFTESHEGTLIGVFNYNNKWYYSTRRHIDMYQTHQYIYGKKSELSYGEMFEDALRKINSTKDDFESKLDSNLQYYFELIHNKNVFNISYEDTYGQHYAKLLLLFVRDQNNELVNDMRDISNTLQISINQELTLEEVTQKLNSKEKIEGFIFERIDNNGVKHVCKVLHPDCQSIIKYSPGFKTIQEQYIYLYQKDLLHEYVILHNKLIYGTLESKNIETVGLLSNYFSYIAQRLLDIYYKFNNNNMVHRNEDLFKQIFMENKKYPIIFYALGKMKGIHKYKQIDIIEIKKLLKYHIIASDIWKLSNEINTFQNEEKGVISETANTLVKFFM